MYIANIKLFTKNEKELETIILAIKIYSNNIGMGFAIEKCHANNEKWKTTNDGRNRTTKSRKYKTALRKENCKYLGILKTDRIKHVPMKVKFKKKYFRRMRKLFETKLHNINLIKGIITWTVSLVRYLRPFLKWTREELQQMDQRIRKLMIVEKALHPRDDLERLHVSR